MDTDADRLQMLPVIFPHRTEIALSHGKRLAELTPDEETAYGCLFTALMEGGAPRQIAIRQTWEDMQRAFPRLTDFHGPAVSLG